MLSDSSKHTMPAPPSPLKVSHRYRSSIDDSPMSPRSTGNGFVLESPKSPQTPRLSAPPSPITSRNNSTAMSDNRDFGDFTGGAEANGGGMGNLADELADAWEEEDDGYGYASGQEMSRAGSQQLGQSDGEDAYLQSVHGMRARSPSVSSERDAPHLSRNNNRTSHLRQHRRQESQYDGSDYGPDSDLDEATDVSPALENQMAEIEGLARRGIENNGSENDLVIQRVVESLKDLGAQSGIENGAMRLITAHSSITSHLTHQTRILQTLIHPLLFSPSLLLSEDAIDSLLPLIDEGLLPNLPDPFPDQPRSSGPTAPQSSAHNPLASLQSLISQTAEITQLLRGLSDTLYESRQLTFTASRRLRSARELVADIRREDESREEGSRWIEKGEWDRRLKDREAGKVCGDVVSGFEAVCGEWREKLFGTHAEVSAA